MNNKAYTLVELLAIILILSVLAVIGIISVDSILKKGTDKAYDAQINEMKNAAENYIKIDGEPSWCQSKSVCYITLRFLALNNQLKLDDEGKFINPETNESFSLETLIKITKYGENFSVKVLDEMNQENLNEINSNKKEALYSSSYLAYIKDKCTKVNGVCEFNTKNLEEWNLLERDYYSNVNIVVSENSISIG